MPSVSTALANSLRPRTMAAYNNQFLTFIQFTAYIGYSHYEDVNLILAFMQCLTHNHISKASVQNYLSAIKYYYILYNLDYQVFTHPKVNMLLRSLAINRPLNCKIKGVIDIPMLHILYRPVTSWITHRYSEQCF